MGCGQPPQVSGLSFLDENALYIRPLFTSSPAESYWSLLWWVDCDYNEILLPNSATSVHILLTRTL